MNMLSQIHTFKKKKGYVCMHVCIIYTNGMGLLHAEVYYSGFVFKYLPFKVNYKQLKPSEHLTSLFQCKTSPP